MHPAPARIAAPPRPKSRASWNPAVPPPPVAGAAVGNELDEDLGVADALAKGLVPALGVADALAEGLVRALDVADGLAAALVRALGVVTVAVRLGETVGDADAGAQGVNFGSVAEGVDPEQAATDAEASMVTVAQPAAVSLAPNPIPAVVVRILMGPPHTSGRWRTVSRSPHQNRYRKGSRGPTRSLPAIAGAGRSRKGRRP